MYTETDIENANEVLRFLVEKAEENIQGIMADHLGDSEYQLNIENMDKNLESAGRQDAVGAVAQGTGIVKDEVGIDGEPGQRAIKLLKERFRIQQCGRGRGRVIIVLDDTPLEAEQAEDEPDQTPVMVEEAEKKTADAAFDDLADQMRDRHHQAIDRIHEQDEVIGNLKDQVGNLEQEIAELNEKLEQASAATWS